MKTFVLSLLPLVFGTVAFAAPSFAGTFLFRIPSMPATAQPCLAEAQALGQRLATTAGVTIDRTYCASTVNGYYDLNVVYVAPKALKKLDSMNHNELDAGMGQGIYASFKDCLADFMQQRDAFATMTGTPVVAAYCARELESSLSYYPAIISLVIDDAVHPTLIYNTYQLFGNVPTNAVTLAQSLETKLRATGLKVRRVVFAQSLFDTRLQVSYYDVKPTKLSVVKVTTFESASACDGRGAAIAAAYTQFGSMNYGTFCSQENYATTASFYLIQPLTSTGPLWLDVPGDYATRMVCEADKSRVVARYMAEGTTVVGSFCEYRGGVFSVVLFH